MKTKIEAGKIFGVLYNLKTRTGGEWELLFAVGEEENALGQLALIITSGAGRGTEITFERRKVVGDARPFDNGN